MRSGVAKTLVLAAVVGVVLTPGEGQAQDQIIDSFQLGAGLGIVDRGSTGVGAPLLEYGYDHEGGLLAEAALRVYFYDSWDFLRHGFQIRYSYTAGQTLGLDSYGFGYSIVDATYLLRTNLPCMSSEDIKYYVSGYLGLSGGYANASTGRGERDDRWNERVAAEGELDHHALGAVFGLAMDVHFGPAYLGIQVDLRQHYGLTSSSPVTRTFMPSALLRTGVEVNL